MKILPNIAACGMIAFICLGILVGCGTETQESKDREYCEIVYNALCDNSTQPIESLFCEKTKNTHDLEDEITQAFGFLNGKIVSYERFSVSTNGEKVRNGKTIESHSSPRIEGLKTDSGKIYDVVINNREVCLKDSSIVGFSQITILEIDPNDHYAKLNEFKIGEYIEFKE